jgi:feruloyl-CoA synthase
MLSNAHPPADSTALAALAAFVASEAGYRPIRLGPYQGQVEPGADGSFQVRSTDPLREHPVRHTERLQRWAAERPQACFLAQRGPDGGWRRLSYGDALAQACAIAQALLDRGLGAERPLMILSGNSIEHALLALAAQHVGIPYVPVSPAWAVQAADPERLRHAVDLLTPGLVFAADARRHAGAIDAAVPGGVERVFAGTVPAGMAATPLAALLGTRAGADVERAHAAVGPDTIAKFLFTSGSTQAPKAVITTHRMLGCNQQMLAQCFPFLEDEPPVLVDWMPWHHTAAGNNNLGLVLFHGGTLYIDEGKPTPEGMAQTVANLREVAPTVYYTVPKGLDLLVRAMRDDTALRERFFSRLRLVYPAGAALSAPLHAAFDAQALATCGARIAMSMGLGMTETAPVALSAHLPDWQPGVIGLPAPGVTVKLVPVGDKLEVRYRGPNVTPGYWRQPDLTRQAFDDEGWFCSGDAARFIDPAAPERGLRFDGRIAEDFKLSSGTWVNVGALRSAVITAGAPYVQDAVITGHDRDRLGMLVFLLPAAADLMAAESRSAANPATVAADPAVRAWAQRWLDGLAARATGSSQRIERAWLLADAPSAALGEITDKGSINQRACLRNRAAVVDALHAVQPEAPVLIAKGV